MSEMPTGEDLAKYPFLGIPDTRIELYDLTLKEMSSPEYSKIVERAVERMKQAIEGKEIVIDLFDRDSEILVYPLTLALAYGLRMRKEIERIAVAEQKRCEQLLIMEKHDQKLIEVAHEGLSWNLENINPNLEEQSSFKIPIKEYLEIAPRIQAPNWKLVNRYCVEGNVYLTKREVARLISEGVKNKILKKSMEDEIKRFELPSFFEPYVEEIIKLSNLKKQDYDEEMPAEMIEEAKPPCIVSIINDLASGKSLSHMARFTLTTFMINVGISTDDVLKLFSNVADFDEGKTRYQVEHIAGLIGSKTRYTPPKCDVLRSFGICIENGANCGRIRHPLKYYQNKARELMRKTRKDRGGNKAG
jgi:DNA primase large subunit